MDERLEEVIETFAGVDVDTRRQLLIDYADQLPPLPDEYRVAMEHGIGRVHECQSPTFIYVDLEDDRAVLHGYVPPEAPTVRGVVSVLIDALSGASPSTIEEVPEDIFRRMGLVEAIGMMRQRGINAVLARLKHEVRRRREQSDS